MVIKAANLWPVGVVRTWRVSRRVIGRSGHITTANPSMSALSWSERSRIHGGTSPPAGAVDAGRVPAGAKSEIITGGNAILGVSGGDYLSGSSEVRGAAAKPPLPRVQGGLTLPSSWAFALAERSDARAKAQPWTAAAAAVRGRKETNRFPVAHPTGDGGQWLSHGALAERMVLGWGFLTPARHQPVAEPLPTITCGGSEGAVPRSTHRERLIEARSRGRRNREASERKRSSVLVMVMRTTFDLARRVPFGVVVPRDRMEPSAVPEKFFGPAVLGP